VADASAVVDEESPQVTASTLTGKRTVQRVAVQRASVDEAAALLAQGPVLVAEALPRLSGKRVLDFMPRLVAAAGKVPADYEVQTCGGQVQVHRAPLAKYIQLLQGSSADMAVPHEDERGALQARARRVRRDASLLPTW